MNIESEILKTSPYWDGESTGAESPDHVQEDYSKDPDYTEVASDAMQISDEEYVEDSEVDASEVDSRKASDHDWHDGEGIQARPPQRAARQPSALHAFNNGVGAELVPWLKKNYRLSFNPAAIMPRSQLYNKYQRFCDKNGMTVVNSACLGKVLRRTFPGVDTRRLGRRGESKYHYIGLELNPKRDESDPDAAAADDSEDKVATPAPERERQRPKRHFSARAPPRSTLMKTLAQIDVEDRENLYMDVFGSLCRSVGNSQKTFVPDYLKRPEEWSKRLQVLASDENLGKSFWSEQVNDFVTSLRIHLAIVAHCISNGSFTTLPEVFRNFWMTRDESLQVPVNQTAARGMGNILTMYDIVGKKSFQHFIAWSYLDTFSLLTEHFTPNFQGVVGSHFVQLIHEFASRCPFWLSQSLSGLERDMADIIHSSVLAFCVLLRKRIGLHSAYAFVQPIDTDSPKVELILNIFREIERIWSRGVHKHFNDEETATAQKLVSTMYEEINKPVMGGISRCIESLDYQVNMWAAGPSAQNREEIQQKLRTFLYISTVSFRTLSALAQTDVAPTEAIPAVDPFRWIMEFFQRYITFRIENELVKLEHKSAIEIVFHNALEERQRTVPQYIQVIPVHLNVQSANLGDWFRTDLPNKPNFYAGNSDLEPFIAMLDDRKVPEMALLPESTPSLPDVVPVRKELSLLELLLS